MRRAIWISAALALVIAYPLLFSTPFQMSSFKTAASMIGLSDEKLTR